MCNDAEELSLDLIAISKFANGYLMIIHKQNVKVENTKIYIRSTRWRNKFSAYLISGLLFNLFTYFGHNFSLYHYSFFNQLQRVLFIIPQYPSLGLLFITEINID